MKRLCMSVGLVSLLAVSAPAAAQEETPFEGIYLSLSPGLFTAFVTSGGGIFYEYRVEGGKFFEVGKLKAAGGAYLEHLVSSGHVLQIGGSYRLGAVMREKLYAYGMLGGGVSLVFIFNDVAIGGQFEVGGGAQYAVTGPLLLGGELQVDFIFGSGGVAVALEPRVVATLSF